MDSAYFDRMTDDQQAVLLIENAQKNIVVPLDSLPVGSEPGQWFLVNFEHDELLAIQYDEKKTNKMTEEIQNRLSHLQAKKTSRFKRRS